jgi:hypothetical protein
MGRILNMVYAGNHIRALRDVRAQESTYPATIIATDGADTAFIATEPPVFPIQISILVFGKVFEWFSHL